MQAQALRQALQSAKAGDPAAFHRTLAVAAFRERSVSISLANPQDPDCPLVGISQGFEAVTGYSRSEVLGRNCRFLSTGCTISAEDRHRMRIAVRTGRNFTGVLHNRTKSGAVFRNLLHMTTLRIGMHRYILGIQADVTGMEVDLAREETMAEMQRLIDIIFEANVNGWATLQLSQYNASKLGSVLPYAESLLQPCCNPMRYKQARDAFVSVEVSLLDSRIQDKNTFLEVYDTENDPKIQLMGLRRVSSAPALPVANALVQVDFTPPARKLAKEVVEVALQPSMSSYVEAKSSETLDYAAIPDNSAHSSIEDIPLYLQPPPGIDAEADENVWHCSNGPQKSVGSALHPDKCKACSFYCYSFIGCSRGLDCKYCHMDHPRRGRRRGRKHRHRTDLTEASEMQAPNQRLFVPQPPMGILSLLTALELLAPLPTPAALSEKASIKKALPLAATASSETPAELSLSYTEAILVFVVGQWRNCLPFVSGPSRAMKFTIRPALPRGINLDPFNGVISGLASEATDGSHTVFVKGPSGEAEARVQLLVLDSLAEVSSQHGDPPSPYMSEEEG